MTYQVIIKPSVNKAIRKLPRDIQRKVLHLFEAFRDNPRTVGTTKLAGDENLWRIRISDYRVIYEIHDKQLIILVVRVAHRKDVYR